MTTTPMDNPKPDDKALLTTAILLELATIGLLLMDGLASLIGVLITGLVAFGFGGLAALSGKGRAYRLGGVSVMIVSLILLWPLLRAIASAE